jgi:hypothetical protein
MKKFAVIALMIGIGAVPALAQDYNFSINDGTVSATGTLDFVFAPALNADLVTGGTITVSGGETVGGYTIPSGTGTLLANTNLAVGSTAWASDTLYNGGDNLIYDDLLYPGTQELVDGYGLIFTYGSGNTAFSISNDSGGVPGTNPNNYAIIVGQIYAPRGYYGPDTSNFAVPDGGTTLALLGLAVAGLAGLRRKLSK